MGKDVLISSIVYDIHNCAVNFALNTVNICEGALKGCVIFKCYTKPRKTVFT